MSVFTDAEIEFLTTRHMLGRVATVAPDGMPHVAPVGWRYNPELDAIEVGGRDLPATKKFRDVARTGKAAIVIDGVEQPWRPFGIEVRGRAEAVTGPPDVIRIYPVRIVSWNVEPDGRLNARTVSRPARSS